MSIDDDDDIPAVGPVVELQTLAEVDNDNDGKRSRFLLRVDASGHLTHLISDRFEEAKPPREWAFGPVVRNCPARGADRVDRRCGCGVEIEHARGYTSAMRLVTPDLDPALGGSLNLIYLRNYAIFGNHDVRDFPFMRVERVDEAWGLYVWSQGARKRVGGIFIHRANRGIGSITACVGGPCPREWSYRGRGNNERLPAIWDVSLRPYRTPRRW